MLARPTSTRNCLEPLRSGAVVAVTTDNVILAGLADQNEGEFKVVGKPFTEEPYGIGLAKDDTEFRTFINDMLEESYEDGSWAAAWDATAGTVLDVRRAAGGRPLLAAPRRIRSGRPHRPPDRQSAPAARLTDRTTAERR